MDKAILKELDSRLTVMELLRSNGYNYKMRELTCVSSATLQDEMRTKSEWRSKVNIAFIWYVLCERFSIEYPSPPLFSEPIVIVTKPQSMKVIRGSDVRLECAVKADATTPFTTSWIKNKKQVTFGWR